MIGSRTKLAALIVATGGGAIVWRSEDLEIAGLVAMVAFTIVLIAEVPLSTAGSEMVSGPGDRVELSHNVLDQQSGASADRASGVG